MTEEAIAYLEQLVSIIADTKANEYLLMAIAALRETEPRLLTLEELKDETTNATPVWVENREADKSGVKGWWEIWKDYFLNSGFGVEWRMWTRKPTAEQMAAEKWEGAE